MENNTNINSTDNSTVVFEGININKVDKVLYTAKTHTTGGRNGASRSSDGRLDIKHTSPGLPGNGTNPEQLFAAGWSACFEGAMGIAAKKSMLLFQPNLRLMQK